MRTLELFSEARSAFTHPAFRATPLDEFAFRVRPADARPSPRRLLLVGLVHGNEIGGADALLACAHHFAASDSRDFEITFALGNVEAARAGRRYLERDLNRSFDRPAGPERECALAARLARFVDHADLVIDFHQTVQPSENAFLIFPHTANNFSFACKVAGANHMVTYRGAFSADGLSLGGYASGLGKSSVTFEMGELGSSPAQTANAAGVFARALSAAPAPAPSAVYTYADFFVAGAPGRALKPGLRNFTRVSAGESLTASGDVVSPLDGFVLFPKYGELARASHELCRIVVVVDPRTFA